MQKPPVRQVGSLRRGWAGSAGRRPGRDLPVAHAANPPIPEHWVPAIDPDVAVLHRQTATSHSRIDPPILTIFVSPFSRRSVRQIGIPDHLGPSPNLA